MKARVIIGANLGDEGKGTVVATYTKHAKGKVLNVLTNGGAQRAHSILTDEGNFTFQHFGSGTYYGADNYYSCFYILNPLQFTAEYNPKFQVKLFRDPRCKWSTPYDMMANLIAESSRKDYKHGSCGMGIWRTIVRYNNSSTIDFDDFMNFNPKDQLKYLESVKSFHERNLRGIPYDWKSIWDDPGIIAHFLSDCKFFYSLVKSISLPELLRSGYDEVIFENGQGLLLTDTGKDIPGTTPSCTGSTYATALMRMAGIDEQQASYHYVTRPYLTRHGNGYIEGECDKYMLSKNVLEDRTNHYNDNQGKFRYGWLDIEDLFIRVMDDCSQISRANNPILEVTHCDEMDRISEFKHEFKLVNTYDSALIK
jgi:adenylosuccinate synthase